MKQKINEEVSVIMYYSAKRKHAVPYIVHWHGRDYPVGKVGYYHNYLEGRERQHIFELVDKEESMWFRLRLDGSNLHWTLESIHDGLPS